MISSMEIALIITLIVTIILTFSIKKRKTDLYRLFKVLFILTIILESSVLLLTVVKDYIQNPNDLMKIDSLSYIATCNLPVVFLFIALKYWKKDINLKKYCWLFIIPAISLLVIFTNDFHHLFCQQYSINVSNVIVGPYFYIHTVYTYLLLIIAYVIIVKSSINKSGFLSLGTILIIIGALAPIIPNILGMFKILTVETYITPIMFLITTICFYISIFKLKSLDTVPIALKNIMDIMTDSFIVIEKDGVVSYINKTYYNSIANYIPLKIGDNFYNAIKNNEYIKENYKNIINNINKAKDTNEVSTYILTMKKLKEYFDIRFKSVFTAGKKKEHIGTLIMFRDITKEKENQEIMSSQEQLATLGQLAGGMAHDINTPISAIDFSIDYLLEEIKDENLQEMLKRMKNCSTKIISIVNSMRNQIRNLGNTESAWFDFNNVVVDITAITHNELQRTRCTLELDVEKELNIYGEETKLGQVITNLIVNSAQAYEAQNITGPIILKAYKKDKDIIIEVMDKAKGIPKNLQNSIFKEVLTTKGTKGTGIGLTIAYSIIKGNFGGDMSFKTKEGEGTTFTIKLNNERIDKDGK